MKKNLLVILALLILLPGLCASRAYGLKVSAHVKDGQGIVKAFLDDGSPAHHADVQVKSMQRQLMLEGEIDASGQFIFDYDFPQNTLLLITVITKDRQRKELIMREALVAPRKPLAIVSPGKVIAGFLIFIVVMIGAMYLQKRQL